MNPLINAADSTLWLVFWLICFEIAVLFLLRFFRNRRSKPKPQPDDDWLYDILQTPPEHRPTDVPKKNKTPRARRRP